MVTRDLAARSLALAVRALPATQREWGLAMQAELATVEDAAERRSFALGCTRTLLRRIVPRVTAYLAAAVVVFLLLSPPPGARPVAIGVIAVYLLAARSVRAPARRVAAAGAALWWIALLASDGARTHPVIALAIVAAAVLASRSLAAGAATCLAIFVIATGTYAAAPDLAPRVSPTRAQDQVESTDPYVAELLLGAALAAAGLAVSVPGRMKRA
jgi:hypothetical protein